MIIACSLLTISTVNSINESINYVCSYNNTDCFQKYSVAVGIKPLSGNPKECFTGYINETTGLCDTQSSELNQDVVEQLSILKELVKQYANQIFTQNMIALGFIGLILVVIEVIMRIKSRFD